MRSTAILAVAAVTQGCALAQSIHPGEHDARQAVTVCMEFGFDTPLLKRAEEVASKMFAEIGVEIEWSGRADCHLRNGAIVVTLSYQTPAREYPGAYAFAAPYEGTHIVVFWDRIQRRLPPPSSSILPAHVLAHEITHMLQGISRHSESGVMKADWSEDDLFQMGTRPLPFTEQDVVLIHRGIAARSASPRRSEK